MNNTLTIESGLQTSAITGVSDRYRHFSTAEITKTLQAQGWFLAKQDEAKLKGKSVKRQGYQKHILIFENHKFVNAEGRIQLVIRNAHDKSAALEIFLGFMRIVCANQLFAKSLGNGMHFRIRHTEAGMRHLQEAIAIVTGNVGQMNDNIAFLKAKELSPEQVKVFTNRAIELRFGENSKQLSGINQEKLHIPKREEDRGSNAWVVFQRLQEQFVQGGMYYSDGKKMKKIRKLNSVNTVPEFNSKLWELAVAV